MIGETVTILRAGTSTRDAHGNDVPGTDTEIDVDRCAVWPTGSDEQTQGQDQVGDRLTVMFPYGTTVLATDRVRARGETYQVVGRASSWSSPFTTTRVGVEVRLERITG